MLIWFSWYPKALRRIMCTPMVFIQAIQMYSSPPITIMQDDYALPPTTFLMYTLLGERVVRRFEGENRSNEH